MQPIILYDTPSKFPRKIWAPNPAKTRQVAQLDSPLLSSLMHANGRFCLSYKGLPYEVAWVEFKDIPSAMKAIGASPTAGGRYTLPVINDPNTGAIVSDSLTIAEYLDSTYPDKPIIPRGANVLMTTFEPTYCDVAYGKAVLFVVARTLAIQNESSREYFINTRLEMLGESSWEVVEKNAEQKWEDLKNGLDEVDKWYQKSGGKWIMGDTFSFADMVVACRTMWWNTILDDEKREELHSLNGGRWARVLAAVNAECGTDL